MLSAGLNKCLKKDYYNFSIHKKKIRTLPNFNLNRRISNTAFYIFKKKNAT